MCISHAGILEVDIFIKIYIKDVASVKMNQDIVSDIWKVFSYKREYLGLKNVITDGFLQAAVIIWPFLGQMKKVTPSQSTHNPPVRKFPHNQLETHTNIAKICKEAYE